jgi:hypothetical protein
MAKSGWKVITPRKSTFKCQSCHRELPVNKSGGTGYAIRGGKKICYECAGKKEMKEISNKAPGGKHVFYLSKKDGKWIVSNWPGSYVYPVHSMKKGYHNIAGERVDVWFKDHNGHEWHGVQIGDNQILRATKLKKKPAARSNLFRVE